MGQLVTPTTALVLLSLAACGEPATEGPGTAAARREAPATAGPHQASADEVVSRDLQQAAELAARLDQLKPCDTCGSAAQLGPSAHQDQREPQDTQSYDEFLRAVAGSRHPSTTEFPVEDYVVVGVVTSRKRQHALVQGPDGEQHVVGPRSPLGRDGSVILRVERNGVVVRHRNGATRQMPIGRRSL